MSIIFEIIIEIFGVLFEMIIRGTIEGLKWIWRRFTRKHNKRSTDKKSRVAM